MRTKIIHISLASHISLRDPNYIIQFGCEKKISLKIKASSHIYVYTTNVFCFADFFNCILSIEVTIMLSQPFINGIVGVKYGFELVLYKERNLDAFASFV